MARKIKIDSAQKKRFAKEETKRRESQRDLLAYFLIVCEGAKTEPQYFKAFPKRNKNWIVDLRCEGGGINTMGVVKEAIRLRDQSAQQFDRVWAVFDKDSFPDHNFNQAIKTAIKGRVKVAWSNEAFELWYLLHFQYRNTAMSRGEYQVCLSNEVNKRKKGKENYGYEKNAADNYRIVTEYGDQAQAIKWAEKLENTFTNTQYAKRNPCTTVYKLVRELIGEDEVLNKEIADKYSNGNHSISSEQEQTILS